MPAVSVSGFATSFGSGLDSVACTITARPSVVRFRKSDSETVGAVVGASTFKSRMVTLTEGDAPAATEDGRDAAKDTVKVSSSVSSSRVVVMAPVPEE